MNLTLVIKLASASCPAAGEGRGGYVDQDVVHDELGLPFIPARRIRGLLRESALEAATALELANAAGSVITKSAIMELFGRQGMQEPAPLQIDSAFLADYHAMRKWLIWFDAQYPDACLTSPEFVLSSYTSLRQQTAIGKDGIAYGGSLRVTRVLNRDLEFRAGIVCEDKPLFKMILVVAATTLRRLGSNRNRGFGDVTCDLLDENNETIMRASLTALKNQLNVKPV